MPARTISPVEAGIPKVIGIIRATPIAAERPGKAPIIIPIVTESSIARILTGMIALKKPAAIYCDI